MIDKDRSLRIVRANCPLIYGRYWKTNVALHLDYTARTITNWISGKTSPSKEVLLLFQLYGAHGYRYDRKTNQCSRKKHGVLAKKR